MATQPAPLNTHPVKNVEQSPSLVAVDLSSHLLSLHAPFDYESLQQILPLPIKFPHSAYVPLYCEHGVVFAVQPGLIHLQLPPVIKPSHSTYETAVILSPHALILQAAVFASAVAIAQLLPFSSSKASHVLS